MRVRLKLWRSAGAAAAAFGLTACGSETSDAPGATDAGAAAPGAAAAPLPAGGEAGEAGAASAYAGVNGAQRTALRLQHLKGFVMIAERVAQSGGADEAAALVGQGVLEVYDNAPAAEFGALDIAPVRAAAADSAQIGAALSAIDAARAPIEADHAALAAGMADVAAGLYAGVVQPDFVDPIEYQHSFGAALAARDALVAGESALRAENARAYDAALAELDRLIALWPQTTPATAPASHRDVLAAASRVRLALYPLL
jgi:hypothetical protein